MTTGMATICISRDSVFRDRFRDYRVLLDGREIGRIGNGQEKRFEIDPGQHQLAMKIDWCTSAPVRFLAVNGQSSKFRCGSGLRGIRLLFMLYYVIFARSKYLWIRTE